MSGPEHGRAEGLTPRGAVGDAGTGVGEDGGAVEGKAGGEVVAQICVRGGDADGMAGVQGHPRRGGGGAGTEDGGEHASSNAAGAHLLQLKEGLLLLQRGGGHRYNRQPGCRRSSYIISANCGQRTTPLS